MALSDTFKWSLSSTFVQVRYGVKKIKFQLVLLSRKIKIKGNIPLQPMSSYFFDGLASRLNYFSIKRLASIFYATW